jgi:phage/plasmid-like protein (TIGR03299 family)
VNLPALDRPASYDIMEKSQETMDWLRNNIKIGYVDERGPAWWADAITKDGQWEIPDGSHFSGPVPLKEVTRLLDIKLVKGTAYVEYEDGNGQRQVVKDDRIQPIVNAGTGRIFSYPSDGYKIHPYLQTLHGFIEQITFDEHVGVGSVGLLRNGGVAFLQVVLPEHFEVEGFGYQPYLMAVTSADTSRSTRYVTGARAGVCDNTVNSAVLSAVSSAAYKHTRNSMPKVQEAREKLGIRLVQTAEDIGLGLAELARTEVTEKEFEAWLDLTTPVPEFKQTKSGTGGSGYTLATKKRDELHRLWEEDDKVAPWRGKALGVLQADNTYRTWNQIVRNAEGGRLERNYSNDALGLAAKADREALEALSSVLDGKLVLA